MRAIARSFVCALFVCLASAVADTDADQISAVLLNLTTSLQERNAALFLDQVDRKRFSNYTALEDNVVAMTVQDDVASSIGILEQSRNGDVYELKLDWLIQLKRAAGEGPAERRRETVTCRIERLGKRWKVTALAPVSFLRPM